MTKIKLCGLSREQDIAFVNEAIPDYIGFVFADSRRQVSIPEAAKLRERLNPNISAVGVFVNAQLGEIIAACRAGLIDLVQLHGNEDQNYIRELKSQVDLPVIKAISVKPGIRPEIEDVDYFLFDQGKGGTGKAFDWSLTPHTEKPFFLAGGLNPQNLKAAIRQVRPYGVDLSSGVETDGKKDREKILQAVRSVRNE